eukprot:11975-Prorocentrum_minimum.AAC.8
MPWSCTKVGNAYPHRARQLLGLNVHLNGGPPRPSHWLQPTTTHRPSRECERADSSGASPPVVLFPFVKTGRRASLEMLAHPAAGFAVCLQEEALQRERRDRRRERWGNGGKRTAGD